MGKAATNRVGLYSGVETLWGETPAGQTLTQLRYTGESLDRDKNTARSNTIRDDRMTDELALLGFSVAGDVDFEMSYGTWDTFLEHLLCGTYTNINVTAQSISIDATAKTATRGAGSFTTDGAYPGMTVKFGGFVAAGNNKRYTIASMTATVLTLLDPDATLVTEAGTGDESYTGKAVRNGVEEKSMVIEKKFADITQYMWFNGVRVSSMDLDVVAQAIMTGKFGVMGKDAVASGASIGTTINPASTSTLMTASANVGTIMYKGVKMTTGVKSVKLNVTNDIRKQDIVGQQATGGLAYGGFGLKGSIEAYFEDLAMLTDIINHTEVSLAWRVTDAALNSYDVYLPSLKFAKGSPKAPGGNQDVMLTADFEAIRNANSNAMIVISK